MKRFSPILGLVSAGVLVCASPALAAKSHLAVTAVMQDQANAQVAQAQSQGPAALATLANSVTIHTGPGNSTTPGQQALAIALYNAGTRSAVDPTAATPAAFFLTPKKAARATVRAHAAGCWGFRESEAWHNTAGGARVADEWVKTNGWCGNGSVITAYPNFYMHHWTQYPYCHINDESPQGWDGSTAWAHGGVFQTNGVYSVAFACVPVLGSMHAVQRVAANGYSDHYNDMF